MTPGIRKCFAELAITLALLGSCHQIHAQQGAANPFEGEWLLQGQRNQPCAIFQHGPVLLIVNEKGDLATGRAVAFGRLVVLKGEAWPQNLRAELRDNGRTLVWSNSTVWTRP